MLTVINLHVQVQCNAHLDSDAQPRGMQLAAGQLHLLLLARAPRPSGISRTALAPPSLKPSAMSDGVGAAGRVRGTCRLAKA